MPDIFFALFCLLLGAIAGFLGGLLGIGGGVIIVPGLIFLLGTLATAEFPTHSIVLIAVASSLGSIIFTSASAALSQIRAGYVVWPIVHGWTVFLVLGSVLSSQIAANLSEFVLRLLIGLFLLCVSAIMLSRWKPGAHQSLPGVPLTACVATSAGIVSGIAGIGGGNVIVPTLIYFNISTHRATATASTLGFPIAIAGALGYVIEGWQSGLAYPNLVGFVYWPATLAIATASIMTAPLGVRFAHRVEQNKLRRLFGLLLLIVSCRMLYYSVLS